MSWKDRPFQLSRLRDIGFRYWDPIGILSPSESWVNHPAADEYDEYLMEAASLIRRGTPVSDAARRLIDIQSDHMGLPVGPDEKRRAEEAAAAVKAYVDELDSV
jgi:hypothetical protein